MTSLGRSGRADPHLFRAELNASAPEYVPPTFKTHKQLQLNQTQLEQTSVANLAAIVLNTRADKKMILSVLCMHLYKLRPNCRAEIAAAGGPKKWCSTVGFYFDPGPPGSTGRETVMIPNNPNDQQQQQKIANLLPTNVPARDRRKRTNPHKQCHLKPQHLSFPTPNVFQQSLAFSQPPSGPVSLPPGVSHIRQGDNTTQLGALWQQPKPASLTRLFEEDSGGQLPPFDELSAHFEPLPSGLVDEILR